jgi:5'-nucleotidase
VDELPVDQCISLVRVRINGQTNMNVGAAIVQMARHRQAIAAIIPAAAEDQNIADAIVIEHSAGFISHRAGCVLHENDAGNVIALYGQPIDLANLGTSESRHVDLIHYTVGMLILLTNDDGINAPGIAAMYRELVHLGDVVVVAPETVQSATGHGITISAPLLTSKVTVENAFTGIAVDGRPADCVKLAINQLLPKQPDLVVSGLNAGANVGINVIYSGTVAAAIEAAFLGLPAIATSLHLKGNVPDDFAGAARISRQTIESILTHGLPGGQVININVPALLPGQQPAGIKTVRQCTRPWMDTYERRQDPRGRDYFWNNSVFTLGETDDDTDVAGLRDHYVTVTPLQFDLTDHGLLQKWQKQKLSVTSF